MTGMLRALIVDSDTGARATIRRMLGAAGAVGIVGEFGDLAEALAASAVARPDLAVVEVSATGAVEAVELLVRRLPGVAIVATGDLPADVGIRVIRAGAFEFLKRPVEQRDLIGAVEKFARFRSVSVPPRQGRITAVFSTKGGLGATTLAVNLGVALAEREANTLLVELDTRYSDVNTFLDLRPKFSILDVFENLERMDESLLRGLVTKHSSGLWVLPGPGRYERAMLGATQVGGGLELLRGHFDHVLLDLRHDFDAGTVAALEAADGVLFVTTPCVAALRAGASALTTFRHLGLDVKRIRLVVMRDGTSDDVTLKHIQDTLGLPPSVRIANDYRTVVTAIDAGRPLVTAAPHAKVAKSLRRLAAALAGEAPQVPAEASPRASRLGMAWPIKRLSGA